MSNSTTNGKACVMLEESFSMTLKTKHLPRGTQLAQAKAIPNTLNFQVDIFSIRKNCWSWILMLGPTNVHISLIVSDSLLISCLGNYNHTICTEPHPASFPFYWLVL